MKEYKKQKRLHTLAVEITFAIVGMIMIIISWSELKPFFQRNHMVTENSLIKEKDVYCYKTDFLAKVELENLFGDKETDYFVLLPNGELITVGFDGQFSETRKMADDCWKRKLQYDAHEITKEEYEAGMFTFFSKVYVHDNFIPMETFMETDAYASLTSEQKKQFHNYHMDGNREKDFFLVALIYFGTIVISVVGILYTWIPKHFVWQDKAFRNYLKMQSNPEYVKEKIRSFLDKAQIEKDFWMNEDYMVALNNKGQGVLCETKEIACIYEADEMVSPDLSLGLTQIIARKHFPKFMYVVTVNGEQFQFVLNGGSRSSEAVLEYIHTKFPWIVTEGQGT